MLQQWDSHKQRVEDDHQHPQILFPFENIPPAHPHHPPLYDSSFLLNLQNPTATNLNTNLQSTVPSKRRRSSRRNNGNANLDFERTIQWEDLGIDPRVEATVFSVLPREKIDQFLNDGASALMCSFGSHLTTEQQNALKVVKQRLRAEKKSRREKQRRVHVNNSLARLAKKIAVKSEEMDMNSILVSAVKFIDEQQKEILALRKALNEVNMVKGMN